jgi:glycosyltransferase involved in cell wall biosynthesis
MKIAYLVNRYPAISHSFIRREILALERLGHEVLRISIRGWSEQQHGDEDRREQLRTRYILRRGPAPLLAAFMQAAVTKPVRLLSAVRLMLIVGRRAEKPLPFHLIYLFEACLLVRWLKAEKIEHLHAHFGTNSAEVAMLTRELGGPTWSFTAHGPEEFDKSRFIALPEKIRRANFVVAVSSFGRSQILRNVAQEYWDKVKVVHCGVDEAFHANLARRPIAGRRLVCVGRICEQKGQLLLIDAIKQLSDREIAVELVFAGDGEMREALEKLIDQYDLRHCTRITGWISSDQVRKEILAANALVLPSFAEGLPVVLMEAMALRRPIISTFVAGIPELVQPGDTGWLVPAGDVEALADAIENCLNTSAEIIVAMGERARTRVLQRHDAATEAAKLSRLFQAFRTGPADSRSNTPRGG